MLGWPEKKIFCIAQLFQVCSVHRVPIADHAVDAGRLQPEVPGSTPGQDLLLSVRLLRVGRAQAGEDESRDPALDPLHKILRPLPSPVRLHREVGDPRRGLEALEEQVSGKISEYFDRNFLRQEKRFGRKNSETGRELFRPTSEEAHSGALRSLQRRLLDRRIPLPHRIHQPRILINYV